MGRSQGFTREQLRTRILAFQAFVQGQGWVWEEQPCVRKGRSPFLIVDREAVVSVLFTSQGGVHLWGLSSALKTAVVGWVSREQPRYCDRSSTWLSVRKGSAAYGTPYHLNLAQIQRTGSGLLLTSVEGVQVALSLPDLLTILSWFNRE